MANNNIFKLGLKLLEPSHWEYFETLCSSFLVSEFENLRTMAHPSGDGGRDSELFSPESITMIATQYSVTPNWKPKIRQTVERINESFPNVKILIYLSNKVIGGQADELKKELLTKKGVSLDIRDQNWFLERMELSDTNRIAAETLSNLIALPYLEGEKVIDKKSSPLTTNESKAALLYLGLQWQDDTNDKGLTKLCFDSLVRSTLRHTHSEKRLSRTQIYNAVREALPSTDMDGAKKHINSSLNRLKGKHIKHWVKDDEFCLSHEEHLRISSRIAEREIEESCFNDELTQELTVYLQETNGGTKVHESDLVERIPRVIEQLLLKKGETFVSAVSNDNLNGVGHEHLKTLILKDLDTIRPKSTTEIHLYPSIIEGVITNTLNHPTKATRTYLRRLANSYTLLSFLNETPDVQAATKKLFSHGIIWLDTTVILPLIAECLKPQTEQRRESALFNACKESGIKLKVTKGIIQEVNAHMKTAYACSLRAPSEWHGRVPFLYKEYIQTGRPSTEFGKWLSLFKGRSRPEDDIAQFLFSEFGIAVQDLQNEVDSEVISDKLRWAGQRLWEEAHTERRQDGFSVDDSITQHLITNDIEVYLGVVALRTKERVSELGYQHWLLSFDSIAWEIKNKLKGEFGTGMPLLK